jgi:glycosyltransferase involved in cell wall biosynthesis
MKVLITNTGPWGTGSATVADAVMRNLAEMGHQSMAIFPDAGFPSPEKHKYYERKDLYRVWSFPLTWKGVTLYTFPLIITDPHPRNYEDAWTFKDLTEDELRAYLGAFREEFCRLYEEFQPDVIECQHIWAMDHVIMELGLDFACVAHHSDQMGFRRDERMQPYAVESAGKARYIFAISDMVKEEVMELYGVPPEKVPVFVNGYDHSVFYPLGHGAGRKHPELPLGECIPIITFAGKLSRTKGIDVLLEANTILQKRAGKVLLFVFGSGRLEKTLDPKRKNAYCLDNVIFMGHQTAEVLASFHRIADVSVLPSRSEGFGIAALEAMGCGTPVVATNTGGLPSFVVGDLVEPENPAALAEAILNILSMSCAEKEALRERAYHRAVRYSWKKNVEGRLRYYEKMLGRLPPGEAMEQFIGTES